MSTRNESINRQTIVTKSPLKGHSLNQVVTKESYEGERRLAKGRKEVKAEKRRVRETEFWDTLEKKQLDRSLSRTMTDTATVEDLAYINNHLPNYERVIFEQINIKISFVEIDSYVNHKMNREEFIATFPDITQEV